MDPGRWHDHLRTIGPDGSGPIVAVSPDGVRTKATMAGWGLTGPATRTDLEGRRVEGSYAAGNFIASVYLDAQGRLLGLGEAMRGSASHSGGVSVSPTWMRTRAEHPAPAMGSEGRNGSPELRWTITRINSTGTTIHAAVAKPIDVGKSTH